MINGTFGRWLVGAAACALAVSAMAAPFSVRYNDTVSASTVAAIPNGQAVNVELILDNGNATTASQTWSAANLKCVIFTFNNDPTKYAAIRYSSSPLSAGAESVADGSFTTNGAGQLQTGTFDWEDYRDPFTAPFTTNIAGVTAVTYWFLDAFNNVVGFGAAGGLGFANVTNNDDVTNWSNPVAYSGECTSGSVGPSPPPTLATSQPVPTLGEYALMLLATLLALAGAWSAARRGR